MNVQLSVIVPVYNMEKYLQRCLDSLLNQNISDYEIILVDDGSKDKSLEICDEYANKYPFVHVIHKENQGLGFARNSGLDVAKGKYVSFVDSDDTVSPKHFCELLKVAEEHNADACLGGGTDVFETQKLTGRHIYAGRVFNEQEIMRILLPSMLGYNERGRNYSGMSACVGVFSREVIEKNNIRFRSEREYISEDAIFDIEFMSSSNIVVISESSGYNYYHNAGSLTTSYRPDRFEQIKKLWFYEQQLVAEKENYTNLCRRIDSMFLANFRVTVMQEVDHGGFKFISLNKVIKSMIRDESVQKVIQRYDFSKMPTKQKLFCQAIYKKNTLLVYLMALLQNWKKRKELFH